MSKRIVPVLALCLTLAASAVHAQSGGGRGGRSGGGSGRSQSSSSASTAASPAQTPLSKIEIIGVIKAIDLDAGRVTIAYEPVDALDWPAGAMLFVVANPALLKGVMVGEKVRFKLESQQISALSPYVPPAKDE
jgi:Cu/Ag efflux protein CusF